VRLVQVGSHAGAELATGVRGGCLGPRGDGDGGGVPRPQGKPAGLGGLHGADLRIGESERCRAAERDRLGEPSIERGGFDSLQDLKGAGRGGMTAAFVRVPKGADFRPVLAGLPDDLCQCPHWGYLLEGRLKSRDRDTYGRRGQIAETTARTSAGTSVNATAGRDVLSVIA